MRVASGAKGGLAQRSMEVKRHTTTRATSRPHPRCLLAAHQINSEISELEDTPRLMLRHHTTLYRRCAAPWATETNTGPDRRVCNPWPKRGSDDDELRHAGHDNADEIQ